MAKKNKPKPTQNRCNTCVHDCLYPTDGEGFWTGDTLLIDPPKPAWYCGRLDGKDTDLLTTTPAEDSDAIRAWTKAHDFNIMGQPIGKIIDPCPGYEVKP